MCLTRILVADNLVSTQEGIVVSEVGNVAMVDQFENLNVLVKIPKIPHPGRLSCIFDEETHILGAHLKYNLDEVMNDYYAFLQSRKGLLAGYIPKKSSTKINRRSIWASVGNFLYSSLLGGLNEAQILQLKSHLRTTKEEVELLARTVQDLKKGQVLFEQHTVALVKRFNYLLQREINSYNCISEMMVYILNAKINTITYKKSLDNMIWPAVSGANTVVLTPSILDPEILTKVVNTHETFETLIFRENPVYLYSISRITLVEIDENLSVARFVLTFPRIKAEGIVPLAKVSQLGLHLGGNTCKYFALPPNMFSVEGRHKNIDLRDCVNHGSLYVCKRTRFPFPDSCLQPFSFTCNYTVIECSEPFDLVQLRYGVLFRDNLNKHFIRDMDGKILEPSVSRAGIGLVTWNSSLEFQLHDIFLESPNIQMEPFSLNNFSTTIDFNCSRIPVHSEIIDLINGYNLSIHATLSNTYGEDLRLVKKGSSANFIIIVVSVAFLSLWLTAMTIFGGLYLRYYLATRGSSAYALFKPMSPIIPDRPSLSVKPMIPDRPRSTDY